MSPQVEKLDSANRHRFTIVIVIFANVIFSWSYQLLSTTYNFLQLFSWKSFFTFNNRLLLVLLLLFLYIDIHWCGHACFNDCVGSEFTVRLCCWHLKISGSMKAVVQGFGSLCCQLLLYITCLCCMAKVLVEWLYVPTALTINQQFYYLLTASFLRAMCAWLCWCI